MKRLDIALVERKFFETREKAKQAIADGQIKVNGTIVSKSSVKVDESAEIEVGKEVLRYVSKGGLKLERAMQQFSLNFGGKTVLDVGASTGGFTDVALQNGASFVYAMDVGSDQLHDSLRTNPKVRSVENCHIRDFTLQQTDESQVDFVVTDVSFISLTQVLPFFPKFLHEQGRVVALIKPQFELQEKTFVKNGIVKDFKFHIKAIEQVVQAAEACGLFAQQLTHSPITDTKKNVEYLALFSTQNRTFIDIRQVVKATESLFKQLKKK